MTQASVAYCLNANELSDRYGILVGGILPLLSQKRSRGQLSGLHQVRINPHLAAS
jgi:hypothetical protein